MHRYLHISAYDNFDNWPIHGDARKNDLFSCTRSILQRFSIYSPFNLFICFCIYLYMTIENGLFRTSASSIAKSTSKFVLLFMRLNPKFEFILNCLVYSERILGYTWFCKNKQHRFSTLFSASRRLLSNANRCIFRLKKWTIGHPLVIPELNTRSSSHPDYSSRYMYQLCVFIQFRQHQRDGKFSAYWQIPSSKSDIAGYSPKP